MRDWVIASAVVVVAVLSAGCAVLQENDFHSDARQWYEAVQRGGAIR